MAFGLSEQDLAENLFAFCLQNDAAFAERFNDGLNSAGIKVEWSTTSLDHQELLIFMCWLARRVVPSKPKILNALQTSYFLGSVKEHFGTMEEKKIFEAVNKRFYEYDQAMANATEQFDIVYVIGPVTERVFSSNPALLVHMPKIQLITAHIFTEWLLSLTTAVKELV